jgi:putative two-component system response regulator
MLREIDDDRLDTLHRLARAAEYGDPDTFSHTERVAETSAAIAKRLRLDIDVIETMRQAAPLHDIGKIAIPDAILMKAGPLTPVERAEMQRHVTAGAAILAGGESTVLRMARQIVLTHHEWWNGRGYPNRLAGEAIPLPGRIVALADVWDALTHERPYKPAWPVAMALAEIDRLAGHQFDPFVVLAFQGAQPRKLVH